MRVPLEWLSDCVDTSVSPDPHVLAAELAGIGLEEEELIGPAVSGPLTVARVLSAEPEEHSNGKTVNWCRLDVGEGEPRGIVCGAHNFSAGDLVVAALPGAVLPGDFAIAARKTYGHVSDGMICSARELGLGDDHDGIIVLSRLGLGPEQLAQLAPGDDAKALLGLDRTTLDVNVTPDRGYQLSMRGIAREYAMLKGQPFADPADVDVDAPGGEGFPVELDDAAPIHGVPGCSRFTAVTVTGIDASARTPFWMRRRLLEAGMRPISLTVDVTNYVMLELGQPLHAYDAARLVGPVTVRRAAAGETLTTLDDVTRTLDPEDLLITDAGSGARAGRIIGLAGVMGSAELEVTDATEDIVIEAAHFDQVSIARSARRHRLPSEAAKRFERGVDPELGPAAARRAADLLAELAGGVISPHVTEAGAAPARRVIELAADLPSKRVGIDYPQERVIELLAAVGAEAVPADAQTEAGATVLRVTVPSWRPDLTEDVDLVEEVVRAGGYGEIPSVVPQAPGGAGLSAAQRARRRVSDLLAASGLSEVLTYPFTSAERADQLLLPADDERRTMVRIANPLGEDRPLMRSSLLATLVDAVVRNTGRGFKDVAVFEAGQVTEGGRPSDRPGPRFAPGHHPAEEELAEVFGSVPAQPFHIAGVIAGHRALPTALGAGRRADAHDVIGLVHEIVRMSGRTAAVVADARAPWHPGRCARFELPGGAVLGWAGELHPKVCENLGLPARTVAFEIDLDALLAEPDPRTWDGVLSTYPVSRQDVALVVDESLPAGTLMATLREAAGAELEALEVFDVYTGDQVPEGRKSLALRMTFRAADRTLTADEASALRERATAAAAAAHGAEVRA
ncbi:phenylalanine--tRNA ligase subunit beta [Brevibacterium album]|uniref:phenylalanine--tRNA ligase subunit beta n=1 Tax=Brevibacterium album TaxID=417948 RepID=UPI000415201E|nr:phenylalanine--tRNA ligase subunit beta [Brevibacterium album]